MPSELVYWQGLIGQTEQIGAELIAKREQAARPGSEDSVCHRVPRAVDRLFEDHATDSGSNRLAWILIEGQGGRLGHKVPRCRVEFSSFEKRLESILVERRPHNVAKGCRCELKQMRSVAQRIFNTGQLASGDHFDPVKPYCRVKGLNVIHYTLPP